MRPHEPEMIVVRRYQERKERRLMRQSIKIADKLPWDEAVCVMTGALTRAIWREGGTLADAKATADIAHHAICADLDIWFSLEKRNRPANIVPLPFKRKKKYFRGG
jgi:hypothetical protein